MRKKQNTRRNIAESVHRIYGAGMFVTAGFIVGFDSEKGSIADAMVELIEEAAIPVAMVGLLYALPNTQLTRRLTQEGRLHPLPEIIPAGYGDQCMLGLNFDTLRPRRDILATTSACCGDLRAGGFRGPPEAPGGPARQFQAQAPDARDRRAAQVRRRRDALPAARQRAGAARPVPPDAVALPVDQSALGALADRRRWRSICTSARSRAMSSARSSSRSRRSMPNRHGRPAPARPEPDACASDA